MQIKDYIKVYKNFLDKDVCNQTIKELSDEKCIYNDVGFYSPRTDNLTKVTNDDLDFLNDDYLITTKKIIQDKLWFAIEQYIVKDFSYSYFCGWEGYSVPRFNRYKENKIMYKHCDHIHSLFDGKRKGIPILSIIGALNNDYEGGELIFFDDYKIDLKEGDVMVFPSNFLYPHRVEKVTKGIRYSYASWSW